MDNDHVVILGAGFSRSISSEMPLVSDLGEEVSKILRSRGREMPDRFTGARFETWLSRLAEPQPDLPDAQNLMNQALFLEISETVRHVMLQAQNDTTSRVMPWFLGKLIGNLHARRSTVITFNYDTLVEQALNRQVRHDFERNMTLINAVHAIEDRPPSARSGFLGNGNASTFQLLKLHGSLDWFWVASDSTGSTIARQNQFGTWLPISDDVEYRRSWLPGRSPFIVPPASAKAAFYANPFARQLWRDAAEKIQRASVIDIVGYSLPLTDLVTSGMIGDALASEERGRRIRVVNNNTSDVLERVSDVIPSNVALDAIDGPNAVSDWVEDLDIQNKVSPWATHPVIEDGTFHLVPLMAAIRPGYCAVVTAISRDRVRHDLIRLRVGKSESFDVANQPRKENDARLLTMRDLRQIAGQCDPSPDRMCIDFPGGHSAAVMEVRAESAMTGHRDTWLQLIPTHEPDPAPDQYQIAHL